MICEKCGLVFDPPFEDYEGDCSRCIGEDDRERRDVK